ncbi:MAG: acetylxylan esterase [Bryobacterales bacterium]|nr:acetylxylan esterase [Bryobacterales bacterium]
MQSGCRFVALAFAISGYFAASADPDPLLEWMNGRAQKFLDERDKTIGAIRTKAEAERRREQVRAKLNQLVGGLPYYNGPLNARVTQLFTNNAYSLEKVIYESLPGFYVTGNVYRPNQPGSYPAVLLPTGHTTTGKTENHRIGANLAAKGFVALVYDPIGLGERIQALDPEKRKHAGGCCANEHLQAGAQANLIGLSVARYFIWDAKRSLDYLASRPDVDANRLGVAGCSGGGNVTTLITAFDDRVKAAAPACYLNSLRLLYTGAFPDSEMSLPRFLSSGLDHADFLEAAAPAPWLILATEGDFFTPPGVKIVYDEVRRFYELYGAADRVRYFVGPGPHGTPLETRQEIYAWMLRWLRNGEGDAKEQDVPLYSDQELVVTRSGQVQEEPHSRKLHQVISAEYLARRSPRPAAELVGELHRRGIVTGGRAVHTEADGNHIRIETEPGLFIRGTWHLPAAKQARRPALLIVADPSTSQLAAKISGRGMVALEIEPRDSPATNDERPYLGNWLVNLRSDAIGGNLAAERSHDILRGLDVLATHEQVDPKSIYLVGRGVKGIWALLAAVADERIAGLWIDGTPYSYADALERPLHTNLFDALLPGLLLHWDLPDAVRAVGKRTVIWTNPTDWMEREVALPSPYRYRKPGEPDESPIVELIKQ